MQPFCAQSCNSLIKVVNQKCNPHATPIVIGCIEVKTANARVKYLQTLLVNPHRKAKKLMVEMLAGFRVFCCKFNFVKFHSQ